MNEQFLTKLKNVIKTSDFVCQEPMSRHTTFRVGGPADVLVFPNKAELSDVVKLCKAEQIPYYIVGNGSNLLIGDKGIRGVVLELTKHMAAIQKEGMFLRVQAGTLLSKTANFAAANHLSGMEFAAGIPGTIGGAVVMNAGAYGGEMKDLIQSVSVLDEDGEEKELSLEQLDFSYRHSCILEKNYIVTEVLLHLNAGEESEIRAKMKELNDRRMEKQPLQYPSAGSTFKRPQGHFAGKLIMDAGLCGYQVGGAKVSQKHCGFVINTGNATASDICQLMQDVSEQVKKKFGVELEPEVKLMGEF